MNSPLINSFDYIDSTQYPEACMAVATCTISHFCVVVPWFTKRRFLATEDFQLFMHSPTFHLCPRISVPPGITFKFITQQVLVNLPQLKNFTLHKTTPGFSGIADQLLKIPTLESFEFNDNVYLSAADFVKMFDHGNRSVRQSAIAQLSFRCFNNGFQKMPDQNFGRQCYEAGVASRLKAYCERDANETDDTSKIFFRKMEGLLYAIKDLTFKDVEWFVDYIVWGLRPDVAGASKPSLTSDLNLLALINAIQICRENPSRARDLAQHHPYFFREVYHHCFPLKFRRREVPPVPKREDYYDDQLYFTAAKNRKLAIHENAELTRLDGVRRIRAIQALYTLCGEFDATIVVENPTLLDQFDLEKLAINATNFDGDRRRESVEWCSSVLGSLLRARIHLSKENPFYLTRRNVDEDEDEDEAAENDENRNDTSNFTTLTSLSDAELKLRRQRAEDIARKRWFDIPKIPSRRKKTSSSSSAAVTADGEEQEQEQEDGHDSVLGPNTARLLVDTMNDHDGNINTYKFITTLMDDIFMSAQHSSNATRRAGTGPRDPCDIRRRRYVNLVLPLERANFIPVVLRLQNRTNIGPRDRLTPEGIERVTRELKIFTLGMASLSLTRLMWLHKYFDWPRTSTAARSGDDENDQKSPLVVSVLDPDDLCFELAKSRGVQCALNSAVTNTTTEAVIADNYCPEVMEDLTTNPVLVKKEEERRLARWLFFVKQFQVIPDAYERLKAMNKTAERMLTALANRNMCPDPKDYSSLVTTLFPKESRRFIKTAESARQKSEVQEICEKDDDACEMFVREAVRRGYAKQNNNEIGGPEGFRGFMDMLLGNTLKGKNNVPHNTNQAEEEEEEGEAGEEAADDEDEEDDTRSNSSLASTVLRVSLHGSDDDNDEEVEEEAEEEEEEGEEEGNDNTNNNDANANPLLRYMQGILGIGGLGNQQDARAGEDEEDEEGSDDDFEVPSIDEIMDGSYKKKLTTTLQRKQKERKERGKGKNVYSGTTTGSSGPRRRTRDGDVVDDDEGNTAPKKKKTATTKKPTPKKPQPKAKKPSPKRKPAAKKTAKKVTKKAAATKKKASKKSTSSTKKAVSTKKKPVAKKSSTSTTKAAKKPSAKKTNTKGKKGKK